MDNWKNNTIWFEDIPAALQRDFDLKEEKLDVESFRDLEYLTLWHYKSKFHNFEDLPQMKKLLYLQLNWSNQVDLVGAERFTALKVLELHYCTRLTNDRGMVDLAPTLQHLHINQSKKFRMTDELFSLKNLRVLRLNACAELPNLDFLKHFPKLIEFSFVDTNVKNGDLMPILEHPTIQKTGTLNKKHYNLSSKELDHLLEEKHTGKAYKLVVKKKGIETFQYIKE